jgi:hypothetical protein
MTAIRASQAKTRVLGSTDPALNMSSFIGFTYGIRAILGAGSTNMEVRDTRFACYRGFYSHQISLVHLLRNEFSPLPSNYPVNPPLPGVNAQQDQNLLGHYGAYLNGTLLGLIVEGNRFFNAAQVNEEPRVGLIARNTGFSGDPIIYRNAFEGYPVGCRFLDQNRLISQGMRFSCNEYTNCVFAVDITASPNFFSSNVGIAPFQGSPVMATGNAYNWAGPDALPGFPNQIWRQIGANPNHTYFYHPTETFIPTESNVFNIEGTFSMDENDCSPLNGLLPNNENIIPLYNEIVGLELVRRI